MASLSAPEPPSTVSIWQSLLSLLLADPAKVLTLVDALGRRIGSLVQSAGSYEVLEHDIRLELLDAYGHQAVYSKRQQVRFLQNNVIAYQDQAWGDGDIFVDYQCSPGVAVDRYREGHRYSILISLRKTMNRGDQEEFHIQRRIEDGFTKPIEDFQAEVNHPMRHLTISVIFPPERLSKRCWLVEQNTRRTLALNGEHFTILSDQRLQVTWQTDKPRLFETYILLWEW